MCEVCVGGEFFALPNRHPRVAVMRSYRISPPEIHLDYLHDQYSRPDVDTGEWIFEDDRYKAWQEGKESKLLWLCSGPGIGKNPSWY